MNDKTTSEPITRRHFFWSGRTLRCDVWVADDVLGEHLDRTEDCLSVDPDRCVVAHHPYDQLIPELLNERFESNAHAE